VDERACVCAEQQNRRCRQARSASHKFTVISPPSSQSHTVSLGSGQGGLHSVLWLSSGSCLAVSIIDADQTYMSALQHTEATQFACSLEQMVLFPRHRRIPRHLRKFCGATCYSAGRGKPWALVINNNFGHISYRF